MIFGIAFRMIPVAAVLAVAGFYWLYNRLSCSDAEETPRAVKDEFVPPPLHSGSVRRQDQPIHLPKLWAPKPSGEILKKFSPQTFQALNFDPDNPQATPEKVETRNVGPFYLDELYFPDGSLFVEVYDSPGGNPATSGYGFSPEDATAYFENADEVISECEATLEGGEYCYEFLEGPQITFFNLYDADGNNQASGVGGGGLMTYEVFKEFKK